MTDKRFVIKNERTIKDTHKYAENGYVFSWKSDAEEVCELLNELNRLAEANEDRGLAIMTYLHNNHYEIWEEVNNKVFKDD